MIIHGGNSNLPADVSAANRLNVDAIAESYPASASRESGRCYSILAIDAGPTAAEFTAYIQNLSEDRVFIIDYIVTSQANADVIWILHQVTGTAAGTTITPSNLNLESSKDGSDLNCLGGAGGVTGLTSSKQLFTWMGGAVYSSYTLDVDGSIILGQNSAIAVEYEAGTGGACGITVVGHQFPWK